MRVRYKSPCPSCFSETGFSVIMEEMDDGTHRCPKNEFHQFERDDDGFWKKKK